MPYSAWQGKVNIYLFALVQRMGCKTARYLNVFPSKLHVSCIIYLFSFFLSISLVGFCGNQLHLLSHGENAHVITKPHRFTYYSLYMIHDVSGLLNSYLFCKLRCNMHFSLIINEYKHYAFFKYSVDSIKLDRFE